MRSNPYRESFSEGGVSMYTLDSVPGGFRVAESFGLVSGSVVYSKHLGRDIMASVKTLFGGEIVGYSEMLAEAREIAASRMRASAAARGANAVLCVRFATSAIAYGMCELLAYGTAARVVPNYGQTE